MEEDSSGESSQAQQSRRATSPRKRKRTSKATSGQFEELVRHLEARTFLATKRFTGLQGKENYDIGWKEVTNDLNRIRNGAVKTIEQWITVWRDLKSRCTTKAAKLNKQRVETGNRDVTAPPLNELEKRVVSLVGEEYTIGTGCPDAMPEEEAVQRDLEAGVVLDTNEIDLSHTSPNNVQEIEVEYVIEESELIDGFVETPRNPQPNISQRAAQISTNPRESRPQSQPRRNRGLNPRRSISEQHVTARRDFLAVAEANAHAMKVLADAMKMQAEAAMMQAEAAKTQGEAAKTQAEAMLVLAEAANKICNVLENKK